MPIDIVHGQGYRIGESNRAIGTDAAPPNDFVVMNQQNNKLFVVSGNKWTDGGTFPNTTFTQVFFDEWILS